jgi:hypothetical protein
MDLTLLKARAVEATARFFLEKQGYVPDPDSDEWEDEYRRQFTLAQARPKTAQHSADPSSEASGPPGPDSESELPNLSGPPAEARWAATLRATRLRQIKDADVRAWLIRTWTSAKSWLDTRDLSAPDFLRRIEPRFAEHRRQLEATSATLAAERKARADAAAAIAARIQAAGITALGLIELVDVSPRIKAAPIAGKLAALTAEDRHLRVFETTNPAALLVIESRPAGRTEYGIERDDGLVADLNPHTPGEAGFNLDPPQVTVQDQTSQVVLTETCAAWSILRHPVFSF